MNQEPPSNSSYNSWNLLLIEAMNNAISKSEIERNRGIIYPWSIRLNKEDRNIGNVSSNQWQQHTSKSGNLIVPFERIELVICRDVAKELHETRSQNRPTSRLIRGELLTGVYSPVEGVPPTGISSQMDVQVAGDRNSGDSKVIRMKVVNRGKMKSILILKMFISLKYLISYINITILWETMGNKYQICNTGVR